jgi:molybdopterin converting factor small subunit
LLVKVKLYVNLRAYQEALTEKNEISLKEKETVEGLLKIMGIDPSLVMFASINGHTSSLKSPLKDGDVVALFPLVAGG